jgi:hypothetical protein
MRKIYFLLLAILFATISQAQVANYTFTSTAGTYTAISGGTILSAVGVSNDDNSNSLGLNTIPNFYFIQTNCL